MNQNKNRLWKKCSSLLVLTVFGLSIFSPGASARLIFTTEDDGVESDTYTLDIDGTVALTDDTDLSLTFGANLGATLTYNDSDGEFSFNKDLNLGKNELKDVVIEKLAADPVACDVANDGRIYYNTTSDEIFVCDGDDTSWNSTSDLAPNSVTATELADNAVDTAAIQDDAVTSAKIDDGTIATVDIAAGAITGGLGGVISDGSITTDDLGTNSVAADELADNAVDTAAIQDDAVTSAKIDDGTIATVDIAAGAITGGLGGVISDGSITADDLGTNSVASDEIATNAVGSDELADNAVDTAAVQDDAITSAKIDDGTIATVDIANNAIDGTKLGIGTTAGDTLYYDGTDWIRLGIGTAGQVLTTNAGATAPEWDTAAAGNLAGLSDTNLAGLAAGNILAYDFVNSEWDNVAVSGDGTISATGVFALEDGSVDGGLGGVITDGSITTDDLGTNSVAADELADNAVDTAAVQDDAITSAKIDDGTIAAVDLAAGSVSGGLAGTITDGSITTDDLGTNSVAADELADDAVDAAAIDSAGAGNSKILTTDGAGATAWVDQTDFASSTLTAGNIFVGNAGGVATSVNPTGAVDISNTGVFSLTDGSVSGGLAGIITDGSITADDLGTNSVAADELADNAVDTAAVQDDAITSAKIDDGTIAAVDLAAGSVSGGLAGTITDGSITTDDLGTNSVAADELADNAVDTAAIQDDAVTSTKIDDGTIATVDIADNAIDGTKLGIGTTAGDTMYYDGTDWVRLGIGTSGQVLATNATTDAVEWVDNSPTPVDVTVAVPPEFPNFTITADGSDNRGTLSSDYDAGNNRNYYEWTTRRVAMNDYDLVVQWPIPEDFDDWQAAPFSFDYITNTATDTDNQIDVVDILDTAGASVAPTGDTANLAAAAWTQADVAGFAGGTFTAGEFITITFKLQSTRDDFARLGQLKFNYSAK